jgi:WhiB family redox-sensing transcriptional regulator
LHIADWSAAHTYTGDPADLIAELAQRLEPPAWHADAACHETPDVNFFPDRGDDGAPTKAVCGRCLVRAECLAAALADPLTTGIWAGTTASDRRAMRAEKAA